MKKAFFLIGLFLLAISFSATAQTTTPHVTKTQVKQNKRIKQGVKSGELTKMETCSLVKDQAKIKRVKKNAKADGKVTKAERMRINHMQNKASRKIQRKKHNPRTR